jgi:hypothetical protein
MNCRRFENELADWIGGKLPPATAELMRSHLTACSSCERVAEGERSLRAVWRDLPVAEAPEMWPRLAARIADARPAPVARPIWSSWLPSLGPSLRYGFAGVAAAMVLATIVMSRHPMVPTGPSSGGIAITGGSNPASQPNESDLIKLVSDQQALLPEADGDLAIVATPRYRQAERYVLGQSAIR